MAAEIQKTFPRIPKVERDKIPALLQTIDRWVIWRAGPVKDNGKFDKVPCSPATGGNINGQDPKNWLTYQTAITAYDQGKSDGIGVVLSSEHKVTLEGTDYYLVALDFDQCEGSTNSIREVGLRLGRPYIEVSPSSKGLRIFALSEVLLKGGNDGNGHELYCNGRFMTVTGWHGRGKIKDATDGLVELDRQWFGAKKAPAQVEFESNLLPIPRPETEQNIALVKSQLAAISSDIDYETWRNIVWSVLSTGWSCAEEIAREWSKGVERLENARHRYEEDAFQKLVASLRPDGGITLGTLDHHAKENGWTQPGEPVAEDGVSRQSNRLLTAEDVKSLPNPPYRVRGLLPAKGLAAIYGESSSGKSFLAIDLCFSIAAGLPEWFGMKIKSAPVVYIALEGRGGISKRIKGWEAHNKKSVSEQVRFLLGDFTLLDKRDAEILAPKILAPVGVGAVVVVDTLNQSAPGADENSSADMSGILTNAKNLADRVQGLVVLIHHAGKDPARGMRGHSSLFAAMDAVIEVAASRGGRSWKVAKAKDDEAGISRDFELVPYVVAVDEDGLEVTSCAVRHTLNAPVASA